jgi:CMP/dCMP kinase
MVVVIVSGFAGCGKSTLAKNIAKALDLPVVHASGLLKEMRDHSIEDLDPKHSQMGQGFWETDEAQQFLHHRMKDGSLDQALDKKLFELIDQGDIVIDSKTMCNLSKKGIRIWVEASTDTRAERIADRDKETVQLVKDRIIERDQVDRGIYEKLYNFELGRDLDNVSLIINNEKLEPQDTLKKALDFIAKKNT